MIGIEALPSRQRRSYLNTANKPLYQPDPIHLPRKRAHGPRYTKCKKRCSTSMWLAGRLFPAAIDKSPSLCFLLCGPCRCVIQRADGRSPAHANRGVTIMEGMVYRGASTVTSHEAFPTSPAGTALCWLLHSTGSWAGNVWAPQAAQGKPWPDVDAVCNCTTK